ncbi:uncharacterized protein DMAD_05364 [Drosophila madeirensis]|uniref:Uncharacterized protein n=1 Tax=Drosophila madeirensis TaxID=30013 RepID=A0AAU9FN52_DROMD
MPTSTSTCGAEQKSREDSESWWEKDKKRAALAAGWLDNRPPDSLEWVLLLPATTMKDCGQNPKLNTPTHSTHFNHPCQCTGLHLGVQASLVSLPFVPARYCL